MLGTTVQEIAINKNDFESVMKIAKTLMDNKYVVMLSYEENLVIINYVYDDNLLSNRNGVVFMSQYEYEENLSKEYQED